MTLKAQIRRLCAWWRTLHPGHALDCIPSYAEASRREKLCRARNDTRGIGAALKQKRDAIHASLAGRT